VHKEELYDLYRSPNIIRVIKLRRVRSAGDVACMGQRRGVQRISVRGHEGKKQLGRPSVDGRIILK
jgi:hypothetical protein